MAQRQQHPGASNNENGWLLTLVDTFERTEQLGNVPCDEKLLSAARARLERPALPARPETVLRRKAQFQPQH